MRSSWIYLTVALTGLAIFLGLAWEIRGDDGPFWQFDHEVAADMKANASEHPGLLEFARAVTKSGGVPVMTGLAIVGALLLWMWGHTRLAVCWVLAAALGGAVNFGSKEVFQRARPGADLRDDAVTERNASYPSGHTMGSTIGYGMLAFVAAILLRRKAAKIALIAASVVLVAAIAWSRVYLRAHWLTDVVGGFSIGICWLMLSIALYRRRSAPRL
jgi:membrane-associated phospholipid phosphatase